MQINQLINDIADALDKHGAAITGTEVPSEVRLKVVDASQHPEVRELFLDLRNDQVIDGALLRKLLIPESEGNPSQMNWLTDSSE